MLILIRFIGYLCSELTIKDISPSFSKFYGTINGISNKFHFDIYIYIYMMK